MKHEKYKELLELNVLGELTEEEETELENHLFECEECSKEYAEIKKLYSVVTEEKPPGLTDEDLVYARSKLFHTIAELKTEPSFIDKISEIFTSFMSNRYAPAFGTIILITLGLFLGYLIFNKSQTSNELLTANIIDLDKIEKGEVEISKVNLPEIFSENRQFEFKIGETEPVSYKGNLNDIAVQRLLAAAIEASENPGFKIKTANIISELTSNNFIPDEKIKNAFIQTLKNDGNPGVRKGALKALINFPYDETIRDALLFTLSNDDNASNRLDAINALLSINLDLPLINSDLKANLENKLLKEENDVIRNKTAKLIKGGN